MCFRCGLKFSPLHKCPHHQRQVLILVEEYETKEEGEVEAEKEEKMIDCNMLGSNKVDPELMIQVMRGVNEPHTLKIRGSVDGHQVLALIDSRANHNFISVETASKLARNGDRRDSF